MPVGIPPTNAGIAHYLTEEQRSLGRQASRRDIEKANNAALQQAIQASLDFDDGLTAAQKFARETGDPATIKRANRAALDEALELSRRETAPSEKPVRRTVPQEESAAQRRLIEKMKQALVEQGCIIQPNSGDQNNCLLISMLQHVTGNYARDNKALHKAAEHYKHLIAAWSNGQEKTSSSLFSDDQLTQLIVRQINEDYFGKREDLYVQFRFVTASLDGEPAERYVGTGPRIKGIVDGGGHYEAFVKRADDR